jgi:hypothetical protein
MAVNTSVASLSVQQCQVRAVQEGGLPLEPEKVKVSSPWQKSDPGSSVIQLIAYD